MNDEKRYIDLPKAVELALSNIAERGEGYVYGEDPWVVKMRGGRPTGSCFNTFFDYSDHKQVNFRKGCIVGSIFVDFGIPVEEFDEKGVNGAASQDAADSLGIEMSDASRRYLRKLQVLQDEGVAWGKAHAKALGGTLRSGFVGFTPAELEWLDVRKDISAA